METPVTIEERATPTRNEYPNSYVAVVPNGRICSVSGLRHAKLYAILRPGGIASKYVRVLTLRDPGAARGKLLFHSGDMLRWFDKLAAEQAQRAEEMAS